MLVVMLGVVTVALANAFRLAGLVHTGRREVSRSISRTHLLFGSSAASSMSTSAMPEPGRCPRPNPEGASLRLHEEMVLPSGVAKLCPAASSVSAARAAGGGFGGTEEEDGKSEISYGAAAGGGASNIVVDSAGFSWIPVPVRHDARPAASLPGNPQALAVKGRYGRDVGEGKAAYWGGEGEKAED